MVRRAVLLFACAIYGQDSRVILLGTGNPNPEPERMGPAVAVVSGGQAYIVDCGPGVVRRAVQAGIGMERLTRLFVTHLHSDHTAGLPDFIFTPAVTGRGEALQAFGPPGLRAMVSHVMQAWREDMRVRLHGLEPADARGYEVKTREVRPGEVYRDANVRVVAFAVDHGDWKHAYGYRIEAKDKVIVISGDTTASASLKAAAKGCDILVHEAYSQEGWERRTPEWKKYHAASHTAAPDAGRIAAEVRPRVLVLYHQLPMGETAEEMLGEVRRHFSGTVIHGKDLDVIR